MYRREKEECGYKLVHVFIHSYIVQLILLVATGQKNFHELG